MSELSNLQEIILGIIEENSQKSLFEKGRCNLKNEDIFNLIKEKSMRPSTANYISIILGDLEKKGKIKRESKFCAGHQGRKRTITIL